MDTQKIRTERSRPWGVWSVACFPLVVAALAVGWPGGAVVVRVVGALARGEVDAGVARVSWGLLASTLAYAVGIGALATGLGLPAAWWIAKRGWRVAPLAAVPLMMPSYLAYAGYGLIRAPRTWVGDWLARLGEQGYEWAPGLAGRIIAVLGLALWAWPIAAIVLAVGIRRIDPRILAVLRLDCGSTPGRCWILAGMLRAWLVGAVTCVALVMLGSTVPLHVAQAPTYSVRVWLEMTLSPGGVGPWVSAWPLLLVAAAGAVWLRVGLSRIGVEPAGWMGGDSRPVGVWAVMGASVAVPLALLGFSAGGWARLAEFWVLSGPSLAQSAEWAGVVGGVCAAMCAGTWAAYSSGDRLSRLLGDVTLGAFLLGALVPGVLVGQAIAAAWSHLGIDSSTPLVLAHLARFGWVGAVLGWVLAKSESEEERMLRRLDGQEGLRGLVRVAWTGRWPVVVGAGAASACLSLHEIESSVFLQLPGLQSLPQTLLGYLHYSRQEELSAACVWLIGLGLTVALASAWTISVAAKARATMERRL